MATAKLSFPESIPYPAIWRIFEYLDVIDLKETRAVSKQMRLFSDADRVWHRHALPLIQRDLPNGPHPKTGFRAIYYQKCALLALTKSVALSTRALLRLHRTISSPFYIQY